MDNPANWERDRFGGGATNRQGSTMVDPRCERNETMNHGRPECERAIVIRPTRNANEMRCDGPMEQNEFARQAVRVCNG